MTDEEGGRTSSRLSLSTILKKPKISRKHLSRYSWLPDVLRVEGSIALHIMGPVLTVTLFASGIAYAWYKGQNVTLSNNVSPLLAVVVGLILVFRNSTSYDRFYEGRKDFGNMVAAIRNLSRLVWVNVAVAPDVAAATVGKGPVGGQMSAAELRQAKIKILRLCTAFAYSVKHRLRGEYALDYADYDDVLPRSIIKLEQSGSTGSSSPIRKKKGYNATGTNQPKGKKDSSDEEDEEEERRKRQTPGSHSVRNRSSRDSALHFGAHGVTLSNARPDTPLLGGDHHTVEFHPSTTVLKTPLPLIIAHEISRKLFLLKRDGYLETVGPAGTNAMNALVQAMVSQMTNMERIATTPIPVSYSIHLKQCVTLYVFALPFTLVADLHWKMIPIVTVVAFTLMGIEGIANQIEMPFGTDDTDLPLDNFCAELKEEIEFIIQKLPEGGEGMFGRDDGEGDD